MTMGRQRVRCRRLAGSEQHCFSLLAVGLRCVQQAHQETHARRLSVKVLAVLFTLSNWAYLRVPGIVKLGSI